MKKSKSQYMFAFLILAFVLAALPQMAMAGPRSSIFSPGDKSVEILKDGTLKLAKPAEMTADSSQSAVEIASTVINTAGFQIITSSGGIVTPTSTPSVSTTTSAGIALVTGKTITLVGTSDANAVILQDDDTLAGSQLELGSTTRTLGKNDVLVLIWIADASTTGRWLEKSYSSLD